MHKTQETAAPSACRVTVRIPAELLAEVDVIARRLHQARADVIRGALVRLAAQTSQNATRR